MRPFTCVGKTGPCEWAGGEERENVIVYKTKQKKRYVLSVVLLNLSLFPYFTLIRPPCFFSLLLTSPTSLSSSFTRSLELLNLLYCRAVSRLAWARD